MSFKFFRMVAHICFEFSLKIVYNIFCVDAEGVFL